jgi:DNA repair photolyase
MGEQESTSPRGRGTGANPTGRFEELRYEPDPGAPPARVGTRVLVDASRTIVATNTSPDVGFDASINPYRGCEHGCSYCYARPTHEYLGLSAGLTDPYQPLERSLRISRGCLEVLAEFRNPVGIVTKNELVTRDLDLLSQLAEHEAARVYLSVNSLDAGLARELEPRTSSPRRRLAAMRTLAEAGIQVGVLVGPVIPGLNDHEVPSVLEAAAEAGARYAGYTYLRLPHGVDELFTAWLEEHVPDRRAKVLNKVREAQGRTGVHREFGTRMRGQGALAAQVRQMFELHRRRLGFRERGAPLNAGAFRDPAGTQGRLFV